MQNSIAHIELNVSDIIESKDFYQKILSPLGWKNFDLEDINITGFTAPDGTSLFLVQTEDSYIQEKFHRKHIGLNHLAFRVNSTEDVDNYVGFLEENGIKKLYHEKPKDYSVEYSTESYYAIFFEDPDRIKLEVVYLK